jgi:hypothetical protein
LREVRSENDAFILRIEPGRPDREKPESCVATLHSARDAGAERQRWERPLVNDVAPAAAAVRDDGRYVVTLGEFRRGGARHALVIYGERGQLLRHFVLADLLVPDDWQHIRTSRRSIDWLDGAAYSFRHPDQFIIELSRDRTIVIDLKSLRVVRDGERQTGSEHDIPAEMLALMSDAGPGDERAERLALLAAKMGTTPENLERLIAEGYVDAKKLDEIELLEAAGDSLPSDGTPAASGTVAAAADTTKAPADAAADGTMPEAELAKEPAAPPEQAAAEAAANASSIEIPQPDPENPVDYVGWLNAMAATAGPNAGPDIEAAIAAHKPWEGDDELFSAAMSGDPAALANPEIQSWLDSNQAALEHMRNATGKEFAGWQHLHSEDGSMIGVLLPMLSPQRGLARAAVMDGKRLEASGDYAGAASRYLDTLAAGAQAGSGPTLIENLVGVAIQTLASEALLDLPTRAGDGDVDYVKLAADAEAAYRPVRPMEQNIQFERAFMLDSIQRVFELDADTGKYRVRPDRMMQLFALTNEGHAQSQFEQLAGMAKLNYDDTLLQSAEYYDALAEATRLPYPQARGYMEELERQLETTANDNILIKNLTPALSRAHFIKTRAETQRRAALLVTNVLAYRQKHGTLPDSLDAFGGRDFVVDPFTGQRFAYQPNGNDFTLYSLGGNSLDDGGVHDPKAEANDVVYWPRPPKQ